MLHSFYLFLLFTLNDIRNYSQHFILLWPQLAILMMIYIQCTAISCLRMLCHKKFPDRENNKKECCYDDGDADRSGFVQKKKETSIVRSSY